MPAPTNQPTEQAAHGNATPAQIADRLRAARSVILLTHTKPDGDAVGSTIGLARALHHAGIKALPVYEGPWSARFNGLVDTTPTEQFSPSLAQEEPLASADLIVVCDTCSWGQLVEAEPYLNERTPERCVVIDHHIRANPEIADLRYVDTAAAAACQMVAKVAVELLGLDSPARLPTDVAAPLYVGTGTDTGWFRHSNTTAGVHRLAADLIDTGIPRERLYAQVEQSDTLARLKLAGRALASLRLVSNGRGAVMILKKSDYAECSAGYDEGGGLTDLVSTTGIIRAVALIHEVSGDLTKVSFRSKSGGTLPDVDVNALANQLGGGGHFHAAGAKVKAPLAVVIERVERLLAAATAD
ncbi:MAG: DHH family phosphoesterase [Phycisphaerales bacterium]